MPLPAVAAIVAAITWVVSHPIKAAAAAAAAGVIADLIGGGPSEEERITRELADGQLSDETQARLNGLTPEEQEEAYLAVTGAAEDSEVDGPPMSVASGTRTTSGDYNDSYLASIRNKYGVGGVDPDEPKIHIGMEPPVAPPTGTGPGLSRPDQFSRSPRYGTADEALDGLFQMSGPELRELQEQLFAAGFYGSMPRSQIRFGVVGPETISAASAFFTGAARTAGEDGNPRPWGEILGGLAEAKAETDRLTFEEQRRNLDNGTLALPDEQTVRQELIGLFEEVMGRAPTQSELDRYTSRFLTDTRSAHAQTQAAKRAGAERDLGLGLGLPADQLPAVPTEIQPVNPVSQAIAAMTQEFGAEIQVNEEVQEGQEARQLVAQTAAGLSRLTGGQ